MAIDDIYLVSAHFENPSGASSIRMYYEEQALHDQPGTDSSAVARAWDTAIVPSLRAMMSDDWLLTGVVARKVFDDPQPKFEVDLAAQAGLRVGPGLPANNSLLVGLSQSLFTAKHNGRMFIPGVAEGDTVVGNLSAAFQTTVLLDFVVALLAQLIEESGGTGRWNLGVINGLVLNASPPAKDWTNAFAAVTSTHGSPIVADQKRRRTKVVGAAL